MNVAPADLIRRLPHRPPFLFVSRVDELDAGRHARGGWVVTGEEAFLAGHFPDQPLVPGVLLAEALAQLAGLVAFGHGADDESAPAGRLAQVDVRFDHAITPPADIELHAELTRSLGALHQFDVRAIHDGVVAARGMLTLAAAPGEPPR